MLHAPSSTRGTLADKRIAHAGATEPLAAGLRVAPWYARPGAVNVSFELVAVFVAAVSGALAGRQKDMDLFGMFVVGVLTGMGAVTSR